MNKQIDNAEIPSLSLLHALLLVALDEHRRLVYSTIFCSRDATSPDTVPYSTIVRYRPETVLSLRLMSLQTAPVYRYEMLQVGT